MIKGLMSISNHCNDIMFSASAKDNEEKVIKCCNKIISEASDIIRKLSHNIKIEPLSIDDINKNIRVIDVVEQVWNELPDEFWGWELSDIVNEYYQIRRINKRPYPDTCLHKMRELLLIGKVNYESIGKKSDSKYRKLAI